MNIPQKITVIAPMTRTMVLAISMIPDPNGIPLISNALNRDRIPNTIPCTYIFMTILQYCFTDDILIQLMQSWSVHFTSTDGLFLNTVLNCHSPDITNGRHIAIRPSADAISISVVL